LRTGAPCSAHEAAPRHLNRSRKSHEKLAAQIHGGFPNPIQAQTTRLTGDAAIQIKVPRNTT
jgi:hypothetical protein